MTSRKVYTRKRQHHPGILAAGILAAGLVIGGTAAVSELAAPSPAAAVHAAAPSHAETPAWTAGTAGTAGTSGTARTPAKAAGQHHILRDVLIIHRVVRHRRLHVLPWWLRRGSYR